MLHVTTVRLLLATLAACVFAGCADSASTADSAPPAHGPGVERDAPPRPRPSWEHTVVEAHAPTVSVYRRPDARAARSQMRLPRLDDQRLTFLTIGERTGWYQVLLPSRPNGSSGWLRAADVRRTTSTFGIVVNLKQRRLTVRERGRVLVTTRVAIGAPATPTPRGRFYVTYAVRLQQPDGPYGPFAIGTSAHSPTLATFNGQDAQIALHGTNEPASFGQAVSNGCVRLPNDVVRLLAKRLTRGTPVTIT